MNTILEHPWDEATEHFPASSFVCTSIQGTGPAENVIPRHCHIRLNARYAPSLDADMIEKKIASIIHETWPHPYTATYRSSAKPFLSSAGPFLNVCQDSILACTGRKPKISTDGGTSDARFLHGSIPEIVELGPLHHTAHSVDEHIPEAHIMLLRDIYLNMLNRLANSLN